MLKVPAYQCSFEYLKNESPRFLGKHEIPVYRAHVTAQRPGLVVNVGLPSHDLPPDTYWRSFESVGAEYTRMCSLYGDTLVSRIYPVVDEMQSIIESEIERVARNKGTNPNAPKAAVASPALVELLASVMPTLAKGAKAEEKAAHKAELEKIALQLQGVGVSSVPDVAAAGLSKLCLASSVDPTLALALQDAAKELAATGNEPVEGESKSLDLGALVGRSFEG